MKMDIQISTWLLTISALLISYLVLKPLVINLIFRSSKKVAAKLPSGPPAIVLIAYFLLHPKSFFQTGPFFSNLCKKYGPIISLKIGSKPFVIISSNSLIHQAMVKNGTIFAGRPIEVVNQLFSSKDNERKAISSSDYGETWRILRRNLTSEFLNPSRIKSYSHVRKRVLDGLIYKLKIGSQRGKAVRVHEHLQYAMHSLMMLMCFGHDLDEDQIKETDNIRLQLTSSIPKLKIFSISPKLGNILYKNRRKEFLEIIKTQDDMFTALIRARTNSKQAESSCVSYADTLMDLQLPNDRKLTEGDITSLCSEFLIGGTDTTTTAIQWVMAILVKYPHVQTKLYNEMKAVIGQEEEGIKEDDLRRMPYLKAVILETLRRHPTSYLPTIPRAVTEDVELGGYTIPKGTAVNFLIADIGRDPNLWEDPVEFKPERFLPGDGKECKEPDITGSKEIKLIPFGTGRRICPGAALVMSSMEYFVANLIWQFEWIAEDGKDVDLTEEQNELTIVTMKNPLVACLYPRRR